MKMVFQKKEDIEKLHGVKEDGDEKGMCDYRWWKRHGAGGG